jgi:hypothetical protein
MNSFAYDCMHIDPANQELQQEQPLIEEPEDEPPQEEYQQAAPDLTTEEANPSEEGRQAFISQLTMLYLGILH